VYDGSTGSGGGGGGSGDLWLHTAKEVAASTNIGGGKLGKGRDLGVPLEGAATDGGEVMRPATLHGVTVRAGLTMPLNADADAATSSVVTYELGSSGTDSEGKKKKSGKPSPWDVFEAVVGFADFVTEADSKPAEARGVKVDRSLAASSHPRVSTDADEKDDEGGARETKGDDGGDASGAPAAPPPGTTNVVFKVVGDDTTLWTSPSISVPSAGIAGTYAAHARIPAFHVQVKIAGVNTLALRVEATGATKNLFPIWGDARVRVAPWVHDRATYENDFGGVGGSHSLPAGVTATGKGGDDDAGAEGILFGSPYPLSAAAVPVSPAAGHAYTQRLLQRDVSLTGPLAAAALLRVLRLLAREAYKPVRVTRPPPGFGEAPLPMEVPFVVQASGRVLKAFGAALQEEEAALKAAGGDTVNVHVEIVSALLALLKGNLRRLVAARVLPADVGVFTSPSADGAKESSVARVLAVLESLMAANRSGTTAGATKIPMELSADASGVLDTGLPLFYPRPRRSRCVGCACAGTRAVAILPPPPSPHSPICRRSWAPCWARARAACWRFTSRGPHCCPPRTPPPPSDWRKPRRWLRRPATRPAVTARRRRHWARWWRGSTPPTPDSSAPSCCCRPTPRRGAGSTPPSACTVASCTLSPPSPTRRRCPSSRRCLT